MAAPVPAHVFVTLLNVTAGLAFKVIVAVLAAAVTQSWSEVAVTLSV